MTSLATRLTSLDDDELEQFIELWVERKSTEYVRVERPGGPNDRGRDVIGFLTSSRHEGPWHLYQCKRKARGGKLGLGEALGELGKLFYHHGQGVYKTLPTSYVFVSPRGIVGSVMDLINNPTTFRTALLDNWGKYCAESITARSAIPLTAEIRAEIDSYDFSQVTHLTAPMIVKDPAARPALTQLLDLAPDEAPMGEAPETIQEQEIEYIDQLRQVYSEAANVDFGSADDVLAHPLHGEHLRDQRIRFFEAEAFKRYHRDNTPLQSLEAFEVEVYHGVREVHRRQHPDRLARVDAVMQHASLLPATLRRTIVRVPVKQGMCHHLVNAGRLKWMP